MQRITQIRGRHPGCSFAFTTTHACFTSTLEIGLPPQSRLLPQPPPRHHEGRLHWSKSYTHRRIRVPDTNHDTQILKGEIELCTQKDLSSYGRFTKGTVDEFVPLTAAALPAKST